MLQGLGRSEGRGSNRPAPLARRAGDTATPSTHWRRHRGSGTWWRLYARPDWLSLIRIHGRDRRGLLGEPGRSLWEDRALFAEDAILPAQAAGLLAFLRGDTARRGQWPRSAWTTQLQMAATVDRRFNFCTRSARERPARTVRLSAAETQVGAFDVSASVNASSPSTEQYLVNRINPSHFLGQREPYLGFGDGNWYPQGYVAL